MRGARRPRSAERFTAAVALALALAACAGRFESAMPYAPARLPAVGLSAHQVSASAYVSERRPALATVQVTLDSPRINSVRIRVEHTVQAVEMVDVVTHGDAGAIASIRFRSPSLLGPGIYGDTVTLFFCEDAECRRPLDGSPQTIQTRFIVLRDPDPPAGR